MRLLRVKTLRTCQERNAAGGRRTDVAVDLFMVLVVLSSIGVADMQLEARALAGPRRSRGNNPPEGHPR